MDGRVLGIDICKTSVSAVLLGVRNGGPRVETSVRVSVEGDSPWDALSEAVAILKQRAEIQDAFCVASFPDSEVFYRLVSMPFSDRRKIEKVIAYEVEPLLPFGAGDLVLDFSVLDEKKGGKEEGATVLVSAVLKSRLAEYIEKFSYVGIEPEVIAPRGWAAAAVLGEHEPEALVVCVDGEYINAVVLSGGRPRFVRTFPLPLLSGSEGKAASVLCCELRNTVLCCEENTGNDMEPAAVVLVCEEGEAENLGRLISRCFGREVRRLDIYVRKMVAGEEGGMAGAATSLALLPGAGKPFMNLRKGEFAVSKRWMRYLPVFGKTFAIAAVVVLLGFADFFYHLHVLKKEIALVDARRRAVFSSCFPDSHAEPSSDMMRYEIDKLKERVGFSAGMDRGFYAIDVLNDISRLVPMDIDVRITRLVAGVDDVAISGDTDSFKSVDAIKSSLGKSGLFGNIVISSATMDRTDNRVHFKLQAEFKS